MKIAYLDLSLTGVIEDYSSLPKRYGGGSILSRHLSYFDDFHTFAKAECFNNLTDLDRKENFFVLSNEQIEQIKSGGKLIEIEPLFSNYDIILGCYCGLKLNFEGLKAKNVVWSVGYDEYIHPENKDLLLYSLVNQNPNIQNKEIKIKEFVLGIDMPKFKNYEQKDYIFQCSRHCYEFGSVDLAQFCLRNKIKAYFAGPIVAGYNLLDYIDNKTTFYFEQIDEISKIQLMQGAKAYCTLFKDWPVPWNLSIATALSYSCPIITTWGGFTKDLIKEGKNGYFVSNEEQLLTAWQNIDKVKELDCYLSILPYSSQKMVESLYNCFEKILSE